MRFRAFEPAAGVGEDVGAGRLQMCVVSDEGVVVRALPQVGIVGLPPSPADAGRPRFHDPHLESAYELGDGDRRVHAWIGAEDDDRVHVIGHDKVRVDCDAVGVQMERT